MDPGGNQGYVDPGQDQGYGDQYGAPAYVELTCRGAHMATMTITPMPAYPTATMDQAGSRAESLLALGPGAGVGNVFYGGRGFGGRGYFGGGQAFSGRGGFRGGFGNGYAGGGGRSFG